MKSKREYTDYLQDILDAATKARQFMKDVDFEAFRANDEKIFAVIRALEIIGEAAKNIPKAVRARHTEPPPWPQRVTEALPLTLPEILCCENTTQKCM